MNTKSRELVTPIVDELSTLALYKNQRTTVLMEDIFSLNYTVNKLLKPELRSSVITIKEIQNKLVTNLESSDISDDELNRENLALQVKVFDRNLTPDDFNGSNLLISPDTDYFGLYNVTIPGVAVAPNFSTNLTQSDLVNEKFTADLSENGTVFGPNIEIIPNLVSTVLNIDIDTFSSVTSSTVIDGAKTSFIYSIEETTKSSSIIIDNTSTDVLGFKDVNVNITKPVEAISVQLDTEISASTLMTAINNKETALYPLQNESIGIAKIILPETEPDLNLDTNILIDDTLNEVYYTTINSSYEAQNTNFSIINSENSISSQTFTADATKCGFRTVSATKTLPTYKVQVSSLPKYNYGFATLELPNENLVYSSTEFDSEHIWGINSNDTSRALQSIEIPYINCNTLEVTKAAMQAQLTTGGKIDISADTGRYFDRVIIDVPKADTFTDFTSMFMLEQHIADNMSAEFLADKALDANVFGTGVLNTVLKSDNYSAYTYNSVRPAAGNRICWTISNLVKDTKYTFKCYQVDSRPTFDVPTNNILFSLDMTPEDDIDQILLQINLSTGRISINELVDDEAAQQGVNCNFAYSFIVYSDAEGIYTLKDEVNTSNTLIDKCSFKTALQPAIPYFIIYMDNANE